MSPDGLKLQQQHNSLQLYNLSYEKQVSSAALTHEIRRWVVRRISDIILSVFLSHCGHGKKNNQIYRYRYEYFNKLKFSYCTPCP